MKHPAYFLLFTLAIGLTGCMAGSDSVGANTASPSASPASSASTKPTPQPTPQPTASNARPAQSTVTGAKSMSIALFLQMAKESACHQVRNRMFLIDNTLIFWDRVGNCPDNAREQTLFGSSVEQVLATSHDSIAGPINKVNDEQYRALFETILANREASDLGLGERHQVKLLPL